MRISVFYIMKKRLPKTITIIPLAIATFLGLATPSVVHAGIGSWAFGEFWDSIVLSISDMLLFVFHQALTLGGFLFDTALDITVIGMAGLVQKITAIEAGWVILRDLTNIFFIFVLLFAAITIILGVSSFNTKRLVTRVVIVALLVNFSLFFTQAVVDVSNVMALQFYDSMIVTECPTSGCTGNNDIDKKSGISSIFMESMRLTSVYNPGSGVSGGTLEEPDNVFLIAIFGSIFFLIAAFVFFAGAILFTIRFVILILLMVVSPLALVAAILPQTESLWKKWLDHLLKQSFFAPIYLGITYIVVLIISNPGFKSALYGGGSSFADELGGSFGTGAGSVILGFFIVSALLISTLTISQSWSMKGSQTIMKWGKSAKQYGMRTPGLAAQNTIGRAASKLSTSDKLKDSAAQKGFRGFAARTALKSSAGTAKASFGARKGGYEKKLGDQTRKQVKFAESLGEDRMETYASNLEERRSPGLLFTKVSRKNKDAAKMIRKKIESRGDATQNLKDYFEERFNTLANKQDT